MTAVARFTPDRLDPTDIDLSGAGGAAVPMRTLLHDHTTAYEVWVVSSPDRMRAYMKVVPGQNYAGLGKEEVKDLAARAGVAFGLLEAGIDLYVSLLRPPARFDGYFQVARGEAMRRGVDASIEFHVQPTALVPRYDVGDDGAVDFKQLHLIENCFAGQRVASILPPSPGRAGRDVFGGEIPPEAGTPLSVLAGPGVVISANGRDFTSEIEGRVVYENGTISVSPVLEIHHDVDYSVGNIDFVGRVLVRGSLLDGFRINAKHGVEINGEMGASRITSEGDVSITGGVRGKGAAFISCRNLTAHYIDEATVEATGNVTANKEILNAVVKSLGRVSIPNGSIVGGEVCGFHGVEADVIGSDMGVATRVLSGLNWTEEDMLADLRQRIAEFLERSRSAKTILDPLLVNREVLAHLGTEQKSMLADLVGELRDLRENLIELLDARSRIVNRRQEGLVNQINVRSMLNMGVAVRFTRVESEIKDSVKGPLSVIQDEDTKSTRTVAFSNLPKRVGEKAPESSGVAGAAAE